MSDFGIPPDELENIILESHQADRVRDEQMGGTEIGLNIAKYP